MSDKDVCKECIFRGSGRRADQAQLCLANEEIQSLTARAEKAEAALKPNNPAGESRLIRNAISRLMAGESSESVARDYDLDSDTFAQVAELIDKMIEHDALAAKQVNRADDLQDDLDREKENVRILEAKVEELEGKYETCRTCGCTMEPWEPDVRCETCPLPEES